MASGRRRGAGPGALVLVVVASWALAGCTAQDAPVPVPSTNGSEVTDLDTVEEPEIVADAADEDACGLLPPDRLTQLLGEELQATAVPSGGWIAGQCSWSGSESAFILSIGTPESISSFEDPAEPDAAAKLAGYSERQAGAVQEVADIGDAAVRGATGMAARAGDTYLELEVLSLAEGLDAQIMDLAVENVSG